MGKKMNNELQLLGWIQGNLQKTTRTMESDELDMWEQLLTDDPQKAHDLAVYGYQRRQQMLYGHDNIDDEELQEYIQEFCYKLKLAREGSPGIKLPLFEYSVRRIRMERRHFDSSVN